MLVTSYIGGLLSTSSHIPATCGSLAICSTCSGETSADIAFTTQKVSLTSTPILLSSSITGLCFSSANLFISSITSPISAPELIGYWSNRVITTGILSSEPDCSALLSCGPILYIGSSLNLILIVPLPSMTISCPRVHLTYGDFTSYSEDGWNHQLPSYSWCFISQSIAGLSTSCTKSKLIST